MRAIVEAFGGGEIELSKPNGKTSQSHLRYAPSFQTDARESLTEHPYTVDTLAEFLGAGAGAGHDLTTRLPTIHGWHMREPCGERAIEPMRSVKRLVAEWTALGRIAHLYRRDGRILTKAFEDTEHSLPRRFALVRVENSDARTTPHRSDLFDGRQEDRPSARVRSRPIARAGRNEVRHARLSPP